MSDRRDLDELLGEFERVTAAVRAPAKDVSRPRWRALISLVGAIGAVVLVSILALAVLESRILSTVGPGPTASAVPATPAAVSANPTVIPSPTPTAIETSPGAIKTPSESPADRAHAACSAIIDNIPDATLKSGKVTIAAAYEVTGEQLTRYFVRELNYSEMSNGSVWWNQPTKIVDMCLFDGDFDTTTPGPPGHDISFAHLLVVIDDGKPELWALSHKDQPPLPTTDPATIPLGPS